MRRCTCGLQIKYARMICMHTPKPLADMHTSTHAYAWALHKREKVVRAHARRFHTIGAREVEREADALDICRPLVVQA